MAEILTAEQAEEQLSEQRMIRREKLKTLQSEGRDPYKEVRFDFTCLAADAKRSFEAIEAAALSEAKAKGLEAPETPVMTANEKLAVADHTEAILKIDLAAADGFDLRSEQFYAGLKALEHIIVVKRFAVGGDLLYALLPGHALHSLPLEIVR